MCLFSTKPDTSGYPPPTPIAPGRRTSLRRPPPRLAPALSSVPISRTATAISPTRRGYPSPRSFLFSLALHLNQRQGIQKQDAHEVMSTRNGWAGALWHDCSGIGRSCTRSIVTPHPPSPVPTSSGRPTSFFHTMKWQLASRATEAFLFENHVLTV